MQTNEEILINDFLSSDIPYIKSYFEFIYSYLKTNIREYPNWLSEEDYIHMGKILMFIIKFYGFDFSTEDLSDNFILKVSYSSKNE